MKYLVTQSQHFAEPWCNWKCSHGFAQFGNLCFSHQLFELAKFQIFWWRFQGTLKKDYFDVLIF